MRSRVGLSSARKRYILMTNTLGYWIGLAKYLDESSQHPVLHFFERDVIAALQFDANREVVTTLATVPL